MSAERGQRDPDQGTPQAGVLGNLPHSRPAVRSPRRATPPPRDASPESGADDGAAGERPADLEELARGGLAVAGEAASLGLRLAGRAAAALRDAVERR